MVSGRAARRVGQRFSRHILLLRCWHRICVVLHGTCRHGPSKQSCPRCMGMGESMAPNHAASPVCVRCCVEHLFSTAASRRIKRHASFGNCLSAECPGPGAEQLLSFRRSMCVCILYVLPLKARVTG